MIVKHRHTMGENLATWFVGRINSDQTEGRGGMRDYAISYEVMDAYEAIKGQGVMGVGDGDVVERRFVLCGGGDDEVECTSISVIDRTIYNGSTYGRKSIDNGWEPDYDPRAKDPQFAEYLRLKEIYEK